MEIMNKKSCLINMLKINCKCSKCERHDGCEECYDNPQLFNKLTIQEQEKLCNWIDLNLTPIKNINPRVLSSYGLKHRFEYSLGGFHISNGAFKGAMVHMKYKHSQGINWHFNIKKIK